MKAGCSETGPVQKKAWLSACGLEKAARLRSTTCVRQAVSMGRDDVDSDVITDARAVGSALVRFAKERSEARTGRGEREDCSATKERVKQP